MIETVFPSVLAACLLGDTAATPTASVVTLDIESSRHVGLVRVEGAALTRECTPPCRIALAPGDYVVRVPATASTFGQTRRITVDGNKRIEVFPVTRAAKY